MREKPMSKAEWKLQRRRKVKRLRVIVFSVLAALILLLVFGIYSLISKAILPAIFHEKYGTLAFTGDKPVSAYLLTKSEHSRPGTGMGARKVSGIVIHNADHAGSRAMEIRNYYEQLATVGNDYAGCHFIIDTDGKIVQCIPVNEVALANGKRNADTLAIEFCYNEEDGKPSSEAYEALVVLTAALVNRFGLQREELLRHTDISEAGIVCPVYFTDTADWEKFRNDVMTRAAVLNRKK